MQFSLFPCYFRLGAAAPYFFPQLERPNFREQQIKVYITFSDTKREEKKG